MAPHVDGREHLVQQHAGTPDKGPALAVFVPPWCLAHDHHPCPRRPVRENHFARAAFQLAMLEGGHGGTQFIQRRSPSRGQCRLCHHIRPLGSQRHWSALALLRLRLLDRGGHLVTVHRRIANRLGRAKFDLPMQKRKRLMIIH